MMEEKEYLMASQRMWTYAYMFQDADYWDDSIKDRYNAVIGCAVGTENQEPSTENDYTFSSGPRTTPEAEMKGQSTEIVVPSRSMKTDIYEQFSEKEMNVHCSTAKTVIDERLTENEMAAASCITVTEIGEQLNEKGTFVPISTNTAEIDEQLSETEVISPSPTFKLEIDELDERLTADRGEHSAVNEIAIKIENVEPSENEIAYSIAPCSIVTVHDMEPSSDIVVPCGTVKAEINELFTESGSRDPNQSETADIDEQFSVHERAVNNPTVKKEHVEPSGGNEITCNIAPCPIVSIQDMESSRGVVVPCYTAKAETSGQFTDNESTDPCRTVTADEGEHCSVNERAVQSHTVKKVNVGPSSKGVIAYNIVPCTVMIQDMGTSSETELVKGTKKAVSTKKSWSMHPCNACQKKFRRPAELKQHIRTHTGDRPFPCKHCGKKFRTKGQLTRHWRTHSGERPFSCEYCDYSCSFKGNLTVHMRSHTGEKPFKCDHCDYSCARKNSLDDHVRTHTGDKPFTCDVCERSFTQKNNLTDHMRTHSGEKPFSCELCGKSFSWRRSLKEHKHVHTGEKPYVCEVCGKTFARSWSLSYHSKGCSSTTTAMSNDIA